MSYPLSIAFIWHMHQPYYRDMASGACGMPWVRLHAAKDYVDMLKRLEPFPAIHQTFNFVPSLLDQLEAYLPPADRSDRFLELSEKPAAELSPEERRFLLQWFFLAHPDRMIKPHPRYHDLLAKRGMHVSEAEWPAIQKRFRTQEYLDLQVWFNLAWIDPWLRSQDPELAQLERKGSHFTEEEKRRVLEAHRALIAQVIPLHRAAAERGQIELTTSPYYHPIMPLLCDLRAAQTALPHVALPKAPFRHPEDARWHLQTALARHQAAFGAPARGLWPPEGSVSEEAVRLAAEAGIRWIATDEEILWRTLKAPRSPSALYRPHLLRRKAGEVAIVFRDRELSDLVGFVYSQWDARPAVEDFMKRLSAVYEQFRNAERPALVSIILDGENAWEFYPNDGHDFLMSLYGALASDDRFRCVTVSEFLQQYPLDHAESLPELFSGSWIDGNFATWIGHPEKNAAWEHLARAREALASQNRETPEGLQAWQNLGAAEGSDWMWWFGDTHFSAQAEEFDQLFRTHLANAYRAARLEPPQALASPIRRRTVQPSIHAPTGLLQPTIDGRESSYYEWLYAGRLDLRQQYAAIHRGEQCLRQVSYGFNHTHYYLRIDLDRTALLRIPAWAIQVTWSSALQIQVGPAPEGITARTLLPESVTLPCAMDRLIELAIPRHLVPLQANEPLQMALMLRGGEEVLEQYPPQGMFELATSPAELEAHAWPL